MKILATAVFVCSLSLPVLAGPEVTYVGLGRYACSGKRYECAQVDMNNRAVSEMQRRQYQEERDRAQAYVDRNRREEAEMREKRRNETFR